MIVVRLCRQMMERPRGAGGDPRADCLSAACASGAGLLVPLTFRELVMALSIDPQRCQGHGRCALISSALFDVSDEGLGVVLVSEPGPEHAADVAAAVDNCPEMAIHAATEPSN
ncbi:ferredoxin [Streptomyces sp. NPDC056910]|uniref:ferredoxin n=1 Tax=Streptomyces sp. NPDC056910 TaxID=3345964 RepID=UPI0036A6A096